MFAQNLEFEKNFSSFSLYNVGPRAYFIPLHTVRKKCLIYTYRKDGWEIPPRISFAIIVSISDFFFFY